MTLGPTQLDKLATTLKATFSDRLITIPAHPPELREQLESLAGEEMKVRNSRRDMVRFQSGEGAGAAAHDDIAVSLALAIESAAGIIGVPAMPPMRECGEIAKGNGAARQHCYLLGGDSILCGHACYSCPAHVASSAQFEVWRQRQIAHAADDIERYRIDQTRLQGWTRQYMRAERLRVGPAG